MSCTEFIDCAALTARLDAATGEGVTVAILDSGIDGAHDAFANATFQAWDVVEQRGGFQVLPNTDEVPQDTLGHGTMCAGVIHQIAPKATLHAVKLLDHATPNTPNKLVSCLEWAIEQQIDVVSMSLASVNASRNTMAELLKVVERAWHQSMLLVASTDNVQKRGLPGDFAAVIGVDFQHFEDFRSFNWFARSVEMEAKGVYVEAPMPGNAWTKTTCTSIACPHVAGLLALMREVVPGLTPFQARTFLHALRANPQTAS